MLVFESLILHFHFPENREALLPYPACAQMHFIIQILEFWGIEAGKGFLRRGHWALCSDVCVWSCHLQWVLERQSGRGDFGFRTCSLLRPRSLFLLISDQYFIFSKSVESFTCLSLCSLSIADSSLANFKCSWKFLDKVKIRPS